MSEFETFEHLISVLDSEKARYRLLEHAEEGRTECVSEMRGHPVAQAAKCIILMVKIGKKVTKFVLAVVPGDARVDMGAVKRLKSGTFVRFAETAKAEELAGSIAGTVLPFAFHERLELIVDPALLQHREIYFNAARLDRSLALDSDDYQRIAAPRIEKIALY